MSRNPRIAATLLGMALAAGSLLPKAAQAQDSASIAHMKAGAGKAPVMPILEFTNTDIRSVFRLLSEYSGVDIVVDPAVSGNVSTVVTNKTWQDVVHIVAKMLNLTVTNELGYLYVQKTDDYQKRLLEKAAANNVQDQTTQLQRKIVRISNAKADEMQAAVKDLLSVRGKITVVTRTNSLIIVDGPEQIAAIEKVLKQLDLETNQILIEAKLIQVQSDALQELGINWNVSSGNIINNTPISSTAAQTVSFGLLNNGLKVTITHLLQNNKAEILATPQITTLDNKEAKIFMGSQVPIQTKDVSGNTITTYVNAGTELTVTPQITAPDRVMLNLKPHKDDYSVVSGVGVVIKKQEAETNVVVSDGETVVIGGLVERTQEDDETGIPLLKDIPVLGALFRYTHHEIVKKDLAIFVTPHIVRRGLVPLAAPETDTADLAKAATAPSADTRSIETTKAVTATAPIVQPQPQASSQSAPAATSSSATTASSASTRSDEPADTIAPTTTGSSIPSDPAAQH